MTDRFWKNRRSWCSRALRSLFVAKRKTSERVNPQGYAPSTRETRRVTRVALSNSKKFLPFQRLRTTIKPILALFLLFPPLPNDRLLLAQTRRR